MRMTKQQAVEQLIDGAIRSHDAGQHACAITLAGAAEDAMPDPAERHLFLIARDAFRGTNPDPALQAKDEKQVVAELNAERNWLKHNNSSQPAEMDLDDSILWIVRSMSKFHGVYGRDAETTTMREFFAVARAFDPDD